MRNIEIKAIIRDSEGLKLKARELSSDEETVLHQTDTFFKVQNGRLKLRRFKDGPGELIFYDRPDTAGPKLSTYQKAVIPEERCQGLSAVLAQSNGVLGIVEKTRYLFLVGQSRVHIDDVVNLGSFAEIEVVLTDDQTIEDGEKIIKDLMQKLGIETVELMPTAYLDLIAAKSNSTNT